MTWLDQDLLERKGRTSFLTAGIALFLGAILLVPLLLAFARALLGRSVPHEMPLMVAVGFAPFVVWLLVGAVRGFR